MGSGEKREMKEKEQRADRHERVQQRFSAVMYLLIFAALCYPWIMIGTQRYNLVSFAMSLQTDGAENLVLQSGLEMEASYSGGLAFNLSLYLIYAVLSVLYLITVFLKKDWYLNAAAVIMAVILANINFWEYMIGSLCSNYVEATLYSGVMLLLSVIECIGRKIMDIWEREVREKNEYLKKEKEAKEERKRRLYFPGKYNQLFYRVIWKNFVGNLKDYMVLLTCNGVVYAFIVAGFGMQALMKDGDISYSAGYPAGAGKILLRGLIELGIVGLFMLVLLLLYYLRKRLPEYGVFKTLGIRTKTMYLCMGMELGIGTVVSLFFGGILGMALVSAFQKMSGGVMENGFSLVFLLKTISIMLIIYLVTFFVTHDLFVGFRMGSSADLQMMKEWMPKRFHIVFVAAGILIIKDQILGYAKNVNAENTELLLGCFAGIYLVLRFGISGYLVHRKKRKGALPKLLKQHPFYHRSRSAVWYIFGLGVLQTCIIALFSVQFFSACLVKDTDSLLPYDLVLCAGEGEEEEAFLEKLREKDGVTAVEYPMFRVSGSDAGGTGVWSQNIGISESTYHALKKALDPAYQKRDLGLDDEGEKIYIVHQQEQSTEAQPIDYYDTYVSIETPVLYTGPVCEEYSPDNFPAEFAHSLEVTSYYVRQITGEEMGSLIGILCQGERENIVVFSDTYFEKAKDIWKVTHPYTGKILTPKEFEKEGIEPCQGPAKLVLVKAGEKELKELEPDLQSFKERHKQEEKLDGKVKSYYLKSDVKLRIDAELRMRKTMAGLLFIAFFAASILLLGIKMLTENKGNIRRAEFLNCMGMRQKERMKLLRSEIRIYYVLTVLTAGILSTGLVAGTIQARLYEAADTGRLLWMIIPFAVCEAAIFGAAVCLLTEWNIRQIERKICEE